MKGRGAISAGVNTADEPHSKLELQNTEDVQ